MGFRHTAMLAAAEQALGIDTQPFRGHAYEAQLIMHVVQSFSVLLASQHGFAPAISGAAVPGEGGEAYTGWARYVGRTVACFSSSLLHSMTSSPCSSTMRPGAGYPVKSHPLRDQLSQAVKQSAIRSPKHLITSLPCSSTLGAVRHDFLCGKSNTCW